MRDAGMFSKVVMRSDIGLGEAYMDGDFVVDDLYQLMDLLSRASTGASAKRALARLTRPRSQVSWIALPPGSHGSLIILHLDRSA